MDAPQKISVKQNNRKIILDLFRKSGILSVGELAAQTRISKPTVQKVINFFEEKGMLVLEGKGNSTEEGGKRPNLYRFSPDFGRIFALHLGPDFLFAAITNMQADILHSQYQEIETRELDGILDELAKIINEFQHNSLCENSPVTEISISLPGIVDPSHGLCVFIPHYPNWDGNIPFAEELEKRIDLDVPIYINCTNRFQAVAEREKGVARGCSNFITLDAIKQGVGAGVFSNGTLRHGSQFLAGEVGHMVLDPEDGPECNCGGRGCFEAMVSLKRVRALIEKGGESRPDSLLFSPGLSDLDEVGRVFHAAGQEDLLAEEILDDITHWFALGINNIVMVNDPELVVLQGIYNQGGEPFLLRIQEKLDSLSLPHIKRKVELRFSEFGVERGAVGGACFSTGKYFEDPEIYR